MDLLVFLTKSPSTEEKHLPSSFPTLPPQQLKTKWKS